MKTTRKTNNKSGRELLADSLKLPRDMVLGEFKLSMTGNRELFIENYTNEDMKISGFIANIQFGKEQQS